MRDHTLWGINSREIRELVAHLTEKEKEFTYTTIYGKSCVNGRRLEYVLRNYLGVEGCES